MQSLAEVPGLFEPIISSNACCSICSASPSVGCICDVYNVLLPKLKAKQLWDRLGLCVCVLHRHVSVFLPHVRDVYYLLPCSLRLMMIQPGCLCSASEGFRFYMCLDWHNEPNVNAAAVTCTADCCCCKGFLLTVIDQCFSNPSNSQSTLQQPVVMSWL